VNGLKGRIEELGAGLVAVWDGAFRVCLFKLV
jgi:hypothetical protein